MRAFPVETIVTQATALRVESLSLGVKRIVLSRPDVRNAFDVTMVEVLRDVLEHLAGIPDPQQMRLLLLEGDGKVFSAGADLGYMKRLAAKSEEESFEDAKTLAQLFYRLADFPAPVIAALLTSEAQRTEEQRGVLHRYFIGTDREIAKRIRLAATRDLAWALANSQAFLFNR